MPFGASSIFSNAAKATAHLDNRALELYQSFMTGYVRRINNATFQVTIGGVRIGSAKYSRLAQINLKTRIITFSRFAIENVPERGRRYLVIHELAHVLEAAHNRSFWELVQRHEPNYKAVSKELDLAFKRNVREGELDRSRLLSRPQLLLANSELKDRCAKRPDEEALAFSADSEGNGQDELTCWDMDDEYDLQSGTVSGGRT